MGIGDWVMEMEWGGVERRREDKGEMKWTMRSEVMTAYF